VTKRKEDEETSSTPYNIMDMSDPVLDFLKYSEDNEDIINKVRQNGRHQCTIELLYTLKCFAFMRSCVKVKCPFLLPLKVCNAYYVHILTRSIFVILVKICSA